MAEPIFNRFKVSIDFGPSLFQESSPESCTHILCKKCGILRERKEVINDDIGRNSKNVASDDYYAFRGILLCHEGVCDPISFPSCWWYCSKEVAVFQGSLNYLASCWIRWPVVSEDSCCGNSLSCSRPIVRNVVACLERALVEVWPSHSISLVVEVKVCVLSTCPQYGIMVKRSLIDSIDGDLAWIATWLMGEG